MKGFDESTYGETIADIYDDWYQASFDVDGAVALLADLANGGPALELGTGTGRIALPLSARGVSVEGIDSSPAMSRKLAEKPGGGEVPVTIGDFSEFDLGRDFSLVYVVFNTLFGLQDQESQVRCFETVSRHLRPGGKFAVEAFVPDLRRFDGGQAVRATSVGLDEVRMDVSSHDAVAQRTASQHVVLTESGTRFYPVTIRYAWPSELDLMAQLAGLRLQVRWGNWRREPFSNSSTGHVSVYGGG